MNVILSFPFLICAAVLGAVIAIGASVLHDRRLPPRDRAHEPQHAASLPRRPVPSHARAGRDFPDARDASDPDGSIWLRSLRAPGWDAPEPLRFRREAPAPAVLERVRAGLLALPAAGVLEMLPPDPAPDPEPEPEPVPAPERDFSVTAWTKAQAEELDRWLDENVRSVPVPECAPEEAA